MNVYLFAIHGYLDNSIQFIVCHENPSCLFYAQNYNLSPDVSCLSISNSFLSNEYCLFIPVFNRS